MKQTDGLTEKGAKIERGRKRLVRQAVKAGKERQEEREELRRGFFHVVEKMQTETITSNNE